MERKKEATLARSYNESSTADDADEDGASEGVKIHEQVPVSEDSTITVNLTNPPLIVPEVNKRGVLQTAETVKIGSQVQAQWEGMDDPDMDPSLVGKEGKLN